MKVDLKSDKDRAASERKEDKKGKCIEQQLSCHGQLYLEGTPFLVRPLSSIYVDIILLCINSLLY